MIALRGSTRIYAMTAESDQSGAVAQYRLPLSPRNVRATRGTGDVRTLQDARRNVRAADPKPKRRLLIRGEWAPTAIKSAVTSRATDST